MRFAAGLMSSGHGGGRPKALPYAVLMIAVMSAMAAAGEAGVIRSAADGDWSAPSVWEGEQVPEAGDTVLIRAGHEVVYDVESEEVIRSVHISGTLRFAADRDTELVTGLIRIAAGDEVIEEGFDCHGPGHMPEPGRFDEGDGSRPALLVGTPNRPVEAEHTALIRLTHIDGMDEESFPAIVNCGGRMDFHGAAMNRTWVKLGQTANVDDTQVWLEEPVEGWKVGDEVIVTATSRQYLYKDTFTPSVVDRPATERRRIVRIGRHGGKQRLTLDRPLAYEHRGEGAYRGEVANLSRNVVVESADPDGVRGHTMYHRHSRGSIGYAEFRHLGKEGVLGRYPIHFHRVRDTMRGSSVIGASIWDSDNHMMTIHGTDYLVVRDCVGYRSAGHGFFLEDGTEVYNILDRNLAVQALGADPLPDQVLPFDLNDGAGFWWANSLNTFTRNVAVECDQHGFRFEAVKREDFDPVLPIHRSDGTVERADIRTLPFVRFEGNEAHSQRRFGLNLGGFHIYRGYGRGDGEYEAAPKREDVGGVGPDRHHPFVLRETKLWDCHWAYHGGSSMVIVEGMDIYGSEYGLWRSVHRNHTYRDLSFREIRSDAIFFPRTGGTGEIDPGVEPRPIDDQPPVTVITHVSREPDGLVRVRGVTCDDGEVIGVTVNGRKARATRENFAQWEVVLREDPENSGESGRTLRAHAEDTAGNVEAIPHEWEGF